MSDVAINDGWEPDGLEILNDSVDHSEIDFLHVLSGGSLDLLDGGQFVLVQCTPCPVRRPRASSTGVTSQTSEEPMAQPIHCLEADVPVGEVILQLCSL